MLPVMPPDGEVRAMVQTGVRRLELRRFAAPRIGEDDAVLRIEACGICGSDYELFEGHMPADLPLIPGHEPVGRIEAIGPRAARRWGVAPGDRVAVQSEFGCGRCAGCLSGSGCALGGGAHGFMPTRIEPALWGGFAERMYLGPGSVVLPLSGELEPRIAALFNPLGAGFAWGVRAPRLQVGESIAVLGSGQRGLACVIAARLAGAGQVFVTGLARDAHKLALARELGADLALDVEREDAVERVRAATHGVGVDVVVDTTPYATRPILDALRLARPRGRIVLAGLKGPHKLDAFPTDDVVVRMLEIRGVRAVDYASFQQAIRVIERGLAPIERLHTHEFPLERAADALRTLTGETGSGAIHVTIEPGLA